MNVSFSGILSEALCIYKALTPFLSKDLHFSYNTTARRPLPFHHILIH